MDDVEAWFQSLGWALTYRTIDDEVWADLRSTRPDSDLVWPRYGKGPTAPEAAASAAARYRVEQIGNGNEHKPGEPLP